MKQAVRFLRSVRQTLIQGVVRLCAAALGWRPLTRNVMFRKLMFDSMPQGSRLLAQTGNEIFAVHVGDRAIGREIYIHGAFDLAKLEAVLRILGEGRHNDLLIDVGANIGPICIPAVKRRLFKKAIAFEPDPRNFDLLNANIHLNHLGGSIDARNLALGDRDGAVVTLTLSEDNYGDHRVCVDSGTGTGSLASRKTISVQSETLDSQVRLASPNNALLWMDTQGHEGFILKGAKALLESRIPLVLEFWPAGMAGTESFPAMKRALCDAGYEYFIDLNAPTNRVALSEESLEALYRSVGEAGAYTDILVR